eukprot:761810-Hanusia_phi.AAC.1
MDIVDSSKENVTRQRRKTANLTIEFVRSLFVMTQKEASDLLGFSTTTMKHVCRRLGIKKWPYSRIRPRVADTKQLTVAAEILFRSQEANCSPCKNSRGDSLNASCKPTREAWLQGNYAQHEWFQEALEHVEKDVRI